MLNGIRGRLLLSYVALMVVTLLVSMGAMLLLLSTRPAPPEQTYRDLLNYVSAINLRTLRGEGVLGGDTLIDNLLAYADNSDMRVLVIDDTRNRVLHDSDEQLETGAVLNIRENTLSRQRLERGSRFQFPLRYATGTFQDVTGQTWLFIGIGDDFSEGPTPPTNNNDSRRPPRPDSEIAFAQRLLSNRRLLFTLPQESLSLIDAVAIFGGGLWGVLWQAALFGLAGAGLLAVVVSRTIARPLQRLAQAAESVAKGDYDQRVAARGPTEIREVAGAFNDMSEQVKLNNEAQRELLANVSHDLKTPLTSIQGYSQAIMDGTAPDTRKAAAIIHEEAGRLTRLVMLLTELARIRAGRLTMRQDTLDLAAMVEAMAEKIEVVAQKKHIRLATDISPVPMIRGDGDRLAQVINNLLSNAVKYTPDGGGVLAKVHPTDGGVAITVRDTGIGIPPDDLTRVFERFYQVDKARGPTRGHGLGLAITKEIIEAHQGKVDVASDGRGKGATFTVWLPAA